MKCRHVADERWHLDIVRLVYIEMRRCVVCGELLSFGEAAPGDPVEIRAAEIVAAWEERDNVMTLFEVDGFYRTWSPSADTPAYRAGWLARATIDHDLLQLYGAEPHDPTGSPVSVSP